MANVVALPWSGPLRWGHLPRCSRVVVALPVYERSATPLRFAPIGAVVYCAVFPVMQVALIAESGAAGAHRDALWALLATAGFLPLHARHVLAAARGTRPRYGTWTLAAMAVIMFGALPAAGSFWLPTFHALAVSALITLRPRWALLAFAATVMLQIPLVIAIGSSVPSAESYYLLSVLWRSSAVFVPIWLVGAISQLEAARQTMATDAVVRERMRIDADLRQRLGTALGSIAARGERASTLVGNDSAALQGELRAVVRSSRQTLGDARRLLSGYHRPPVRAELESARALLTAAGISTRLVLPAGPLPEPLEPRFRADLRAATASMLQDQSATSCVMTVTRDGDRLRLSVTDEDARLSGAP